MAGADWNRTSFALRAIALVEGVATVRFIAVPLVREHFLARSGTASVELRGTLELLNRVSVLGHGAEAVAALAACVALVAALAGKPGRRWAVAAVCVMAIHLVSFALDHVVEGAAEPGLAEKVLFWIIDASDRTTFVLAVIAGARALRPTRANVPIVLCATTAVIDVALAAYAAAAIPSSAVFGWVERIVVSVDALCAVGSLGWLAATRAAERAADPVPLPAPP